MNNFVRKNNYNLIDFRWQYNKNNEFGGFYYLRENEIFASQAMIYTALLQNNEELISVKSESSFLSSDYRGKGLFEKIYFDSLNHCIEKKVEIVWGFTTLDQVWKKNLVLNVTIFSMNVELFYHQIKFSIIINILLLRKHFNT